MKQSKRKRKPTATSQEPAAAPTVQESVRTVTSGGSTALAYALGSSCTMREAAQLKAELLKLLDSADPVVLDVAAVERIDTSALQLLCAFVRDRRARRLNTSWTGCQPAFSEAVDILGLNQAMGYSVDAQAA